MAQKARLRKLEKVYRINNSGEWITVSEDMDQPGVYKDYKGKVYTEEEIESLSSSGVNIIRINYYKTPLPEDQEDHD